MSIEKPTKAHYNLKSRSSILYFKDQVVTEYMLRGGICWPKHVEVEDGKFDVYGFALLAGYNTEAKNITVFEQTKFVVVDNILRPDMSIEYQGLAPWFNKNWTKYFAEDYFWNQDHELSKRYVLEVIRSEMIRPKPQFIRIEWADEQEARHLLWKYVKLGKIAIEKSSLLFRELQLAKLPGKDTFPAVHALMCCICGMERYPFRKI